MNTQRTTIRTITHAARGHFKPAILVSFLAFALAAPTSAQIDHRLSQSPVKNQGARGTCVAFSICAAMETFPGVPTDLSEQTTYAAVKLHQNNVDRWLKALNENTTLSIGDTFATYAMLSSILGTCAEAFFPYNPNPLIVPDTVPDAVRRFVELAQVDPEEFNRFRLAMGTWRIPEDSMRLLSLEEARDIEALKRELDNGRLAIPVIYEINAIAWSEPEQHANHDGNNQRDIIHPGMMHRFKPPDADPMPYAAAQMEAARRGINFVEAVISGEWLVARAFAEGYGGHAVTIVGYDSKGFIIKNSWGTGWCSNGYARIAFDYHQLYATEALLIDRVSTQPPDPSPLAKTRSIREADWRLKVAPGITARDESGQWKQTWMLSTWAHETRQPDCEVVEYHLEIQRPDGQWATILRRLIAAGPAESRDGLRMLLSDGVHARLAEARAARVTVRYGDFPLGPGEGLDSARFHTQRAFGPIPTNLGHARDFTPDKQP